VQVFDELIDRLARGATVVTANQRLAAALRRAFDSAQNANARGAWPAADVLPWNAWIGRTFRAAFFAGSLHQRLTSPQQERFLWLRTVERSPEAASLLELAGAAESAGQAWKLAHAWRLLPALNNMPLSEEGAAFLRWAAAYDRACTKHHLLDHARVVDVLRDLVRGERLRAEPDIFLFGFDQLDMQQQDLLEALGTSGTRVTVCAAAPARTAPLVVKKSSAEQEIRAAALWARARLTANPAARIGVVVPDLPRQRAAIGRLFDEVLVPALLLHPGEGAPRPWNVSLGSVLADWPLIHAGLLVLELACGELGLEGASVLLRSAFLGQADTEADARVLLDARLRHFGDPQLSLHSLKLQAALSGQPYSCPQLARLLARLHTTLEGLPGRAQPISFWGPELQRLLAAMEWPGERALDSTEYQAFVAWKELLSELAQLDVLGTRVGLREAVQIVAQLARERLFQPETPVLPIQILGSLEAAHLEFDHCWVLGLTDETWPPVARPNALLPIELQRSRAIPHSSANWELDFARRLQAGWQASAPEVILSWHNSEDDRELSPSPLLNGLGVTTLEELGVQASPDWRLQMHAAARIEESADWVAAEVPAGAQFAGGARLLQDQAACAFRAFTAHRLRVRPLEHPQDGVDAKDRGVVLHTALASLWTELKDHERLQQMDPVALRELVHRCVEGALARIRQRRASTLQERFLDLERERLNALLHEWLDVERSRPPFAVLACEEDKAASVGGLELRLRLDRVDRLMSGGQMLLDYKSSLNNSVAAWFGDRPDEPQLPLYAITRSLAPDALTFARVERGNCKFVGLAADETGIEGVRQYVPRRSDPSHDWNALVTDWRKYLETLARSFRSGEIPVAPKNRNVSCSRCDFSLFCRVNELIDRGAPAADE
jgi:ATP-dependent helicase/nuclease subunit B